MNGLRWPPPHSFLDNTIDIRKAVKIRERGCSFHAANGINLRLRLFLDVRIFSESEYQCQDLVRRRIRASFEQFAPEVVESMWSHPIRPTFLGVFVQLCVDETVSVYTVCSALIHVTSGVIPHIIHHLTAFVGALLPIARKIFEHGKLIDWRVCSWLLQFQPLFTASAAISLQKRTR